VAVELSAEGTAVEDLQNRFATTSGGRHVVIHHGDKRGRIEIGVLRNGPISSGSLPALGLAASGLTQLMEIVGRLLSDAQFPEYRLITAFHRKRPYKSP